MTIRRRLVGGFLAVAALVAVIGYVAWRAEVTSSRRAAVSEARHVAQIISQDVGERTVVGSSVPLYQERDALARYITRLHDVQQRDIVVVDIDKRILGDAIPANVGTIFSHDTGNEIGATIRSGDPRTFIERSVDYPAGIRQVVVPLRDNDGVTVGAVILEYTPLYDEVMSDAGQAQRQIVTMTVVCVTLALLLGLGASVPLARRVRVLTAGVQAVRRGEYSRRIHPRGRDEVTTLSHEFNAMAEQLERNAREILAKEVTDRILASTGEGICGIDEHGVVTFANDAFGRIVGAPPADLLGREAATVVPESVAARDDTDDDTGGRAVRESILTRPDGTEVPVSYTMSPIRRGDQHAGTVLVLTDLSLQHALERDLHHQARHDALTGLPNREQFEAALATALSNTRSTGEPAAVLFIGLDGIKYINEGFGHKAGDRLLRETADRLREVTRTGDALARFGGDQFAIVLEAYDETVAALGRRLLAAAAPPVRLGGRDIRVSASIGAVLDIGADADPQEILRNADVAMHAAKRRGGDCLEVFTPQMHDSLMLRLDLEYRLREAIRNSGLVLHYQPIVEIGSGQVCGVEALVRWPDRDGTLQPPGTFIPLAEETGLIVELDWWVLQEACATTRRWQSTGGQRAPRYVSVNMSAATLQLPDLIDRIAAVLATTGLPPRSLLLEVTETALMADVGLVSQKLHQLRSLGARVALDDFGTGYSSLGYLRDLPADTLKLDQSFVARLGQEDRDFALVQAVVQMGHALGLVVLAEGVEDQTQLGQLTEAGCDLAQGYLLGRPQPEAHLLERLGLATATAR